MSTPNCIVSSSDIVQTDGSSNAAATPLVHFSESGATALRTLKTSEAAAVLNVSPNTLRAWERRFGYPKPQRTAGKHRLYTHGEVAALRDALQEGLSISSAISRARESLSADTSVLVGALQSFELDRADGAMEAALALRALQLFAVRSGARVLVLPVSGVAGLVDVLRAFEPQVVVVAGAAAPDDQVARWAYRVRSTAGALQMTLFRRGRVAGEQTHEQPSAARGAPRLRRPGDRPRLLRPLRPRRRGRNRRRDAC